MAVVAGARDGEREEEETGKKGGWEKGRQHREHEHEQKQEEQA